MLEPPAVMDIAAIFVAPQTDWGPGHRGLDIYADEGDPVRSPGGGVVTFAGDVAGRGVVVVLHPSGLRSTLEPVTASVALGDSVEVGDVVGAVQGSASHCAPVACLHWGVRRGDQYLDPLDYLGGYGPIRLLPVRDLDD
jgi:murein DD-endopeptidase MepM/ murein hydrolase activator NlpD